MFDFNASLSIWLTGLSGSGKSTLANNLKLKFNSNNIPSVVLDGDIVRSGINKDLGFTIEDRLENIRRVSEINKLLIQQNIFVINSFISPTNKIRNVVYEIIGRDKVFMVYVYASIETCRKRDAKGLYKLVEENKIEFFTGISQEFEEPDDYDYFANTEKFSVNEIVDDIFNKIITKIK
ncbi:MAG: adenylyl-sulfate kinase [Bacteroidales bacterium]|nr:adenylyl-sulfate kinase [Bacteroidales bacterium]